MLRRRTFAAVLVFVLTAAAQTGFTAGTEVAPDQSYIVVFDEEAVARPAAAAATDQPGAAGRFTAAERISRKIDKAKVSRQVERLSGSLKLKPRNVFDTALGGFSASLSRSQLNKLQADPKVAFVTPDVQTSLADPAATDDGGIASIKITTSQAVRLPAGVARVGATKNSIANIDGQDDRVDADVAILDTGVDKNHNDLNVVGGYNCTTTNRSAWGDEHGHGTHVAGTVAALDNGFGVVGAAPGARIWSVKVLNKQGTGYLSWLVCGIDWVTAQKDAAAPSGQLFEAANMSLRFGLPNSDNRDCGIPSKDAVHQAICRSVRAGVVYAVAAGNDTTNAKKYRPAAYPEVITVAATVDYDGKPGGLAKQADYCSFYSADADDTFAKFSNYGAVIDIAAPGKCVVSTYPGNRYAWMSGTSMSTPLVAAGAALYMVRYPQAKPGQVMQALQHVATTDWRTGTYPVSNPPKLLWLASFGPPPEFEMSASSPSGWVGNGSKAAVSVSRSNGHSAPIRLSITEGPAGLTGSGTITGSSGQLTIHAQPTTPSGTHKVTVRASDGELVRTRKIDVKLDAQPPTASFSTPAAGLTSQTSTSVRIAWQENDTGGSGVKGRSLQRQRASITSSATCATSWSNVGSAVTSSGDVTQSMKSGYCFRWQLTISDNAGNSGTFTSGSVMIIDGGGSETVAGAQLSTPTVRVRPASKVTAKSGVRVEVGWSVTSSSGINGHEVRLSANGGSSWTSASLAAASSLSGSSPRAVVVLPPGSNYRFSVRTRDGNNSWSSWVNSPTFGIALAQAEGKNGVTYAGSWTTASVTKTLGGKVRYAKQQGARATFTFTGRELAIVSLTRDKRGRAEIWIDGKLETTINTRSATIVKRKIVFNRSWSSSATRTVEVRVLGTSGRPRVDLDAFIVLN